MSMLTSLPILDLDRRLDEEKRTNNRAPSERTGSEKMTPSALFLYKEGLRK